MNKLAAFTLAASVAASSSAAHAQLTGPELDRMAAERNAEMHPRPPLPSAHTASHEVIRQTDRLWVCMSADPWTPVHSSPRSDSPAIGQTLHDVAVNGGWVNGFAEVLHYNGKLGWVEASHVRPFHSTINPNVTCSIAGVRLDGSPVFSHR